ncbi:MAG TPA: ADOP family duplicated permease, partial [Thermoanaerobaculia bacterium]|nr:ADOP family duplicated permease [Thermoanaerobaculia bacterium]
MTETISAVFRDLGMAVRSLRRSPGFTLIAVVTLGLGIGANMAMFSTYNGYALRPAPYADREHVERIFRATRATARGGVSPADYLELKSQAANYGEIAGYGDLDLSLAEPGKPAEFAQGMRASANLLSTLGTRPLLGRDFRPQEEVLGNHRVLIISHRYWQNRFGGDPKIVGRVVRVDGEPNEIVGVLAPNFSDWRHLSWVDVFRPLALDERESRDRTSTWVRIVGRRSPEISRQQAAAFIAKFGQRIAAQHPAEDAEASLHTVPIDDSFLNKNAAGIFFMLIGLSGFVLLIACSNLANLLLARTMARAREHAVRSALGASRARLLRPLFVESLLLAFAGGVLAILVAQATFARLAVMSAGENGVGVEFGFDWRVLGWGFGACLFTALAFGVVPALFTNKLDLNSTLKSGSRGVTADLGHRRFRNLLIVGQFALAMVLLAGAGLFVHGLHEINNRRHGWESSQLVTGSIVLPAMKYASDVEVRDFHRRAVERLEALPGVESASLSYALPFFGLAEPRKFVVGGRDLPAPGREPVALINGVSPHYFETVGTQLVAGRRFEDRDKADGPKVFVVNESMARALFGDESAIGKRIAQAGGGTLEWGEIVGVVRDVESVYPTRATVTNQLYQPLVQEPRRPGVLAVRTAGVPPKAVLENVRTAMMALDPDLPLLRLRPAERAIARANYQVGVLATILSWLAMLGVGLAALTSTASS